MRELLRDLRFSVRLLIKSPVFTLAAVSTLALGIGLNAATFSAVNGLLLRPLPGARDPDRLVQLYRAWPGMEYGSNSIPHYQDLRDRTGEAFESVAAWYFAPMSVSVDGRSERIMGALVSADFFQTYGVTPALGRAFLPREESVGPGAHPVAILGNGFWRDRFGADPGVLGRTLVLNGHPFDVVGVAPEHFKGPVTFASIPTRSWFRGRRTSRREIRKSRRRKGTRRIVPTAPVKRDSLRRSSKACRRSAPWRSRKSSG
ncbi:MAG TPA: ABC transporter permease [Longimicrobiales bacterium]|nr:ABC transporter permease [Longimicrobiales bacterium]